jgi:hypothetical protein
MATEMSWISLELALAGLFGRAAGRIALYQE